MIWRRHHEVGFVSKFLYFFVFIMSFFFGFVKWLLKVKLVFVCTRFFRFISILVEAQRESLFALESVNPQLSVAPHCLVEFFLRRPRQVDSSTKGLRVVEPSCGVQETSPVLKPYVLVWLPVGSFRRLDPIPEDWRSKMVVVSPSFDPGCGFPALLRVGSRVVLNWTFLSGNKETVFLD